LIRAVEPVCEELGFHRGESNASATHFGRADGWEVTVTQHHVEPASLWVHAPRDQNGGRRAYAVWILRQALLGRCELPDPVTDAELAAFLQENASVVFGDPLAYDARYRLTETGLNKLVR
jgi:hypothetical protein